jgi:peptide/nickel transport system permease protein
LWKSALIVAGGAIIAAVILIAIAAPVLAPYEYDRQNLRATFLPPLSPGHVLGTDELGRDVLSRLIYGSQVSLFVGLLTAVASLLIGVPLGLLAGYYGGLVDAVISRLIDAVLAIPSILLGIAIVSVIDPGLGTVVAALSAIWWATFARYVRAETMALRAQPYIEAARGLGCSDSRILFRHILPNVLPTLLVLSSLTIASAIIVEATLSFLGVGIRPPAPSWGGMLSTARRYLTSAYWLSMFPGLAITVVVLGFNLFGDGLRDVSDPSLRGRH